MKNKMIRISTRVMAAMLVAATVFTTITPTAYAVENTAIVQEVSADEEVFTAEGALIVVEEEPSVEETIDDAEIRDEEAVNFEEETEAEESAEQIEETEGCVDIIDDDFWAELEEQGDIIDDASAEEVEGDITGDESAEEVEGDITGDEFAEEAEGEGDITGDEFAEEVEEEGDIIDDQLNEEDCLDGVSVVVEMPEDDYRNPAIDFMFGPTKDDAAIKEAYDMAKVADEDKSDYTKMMELINKAIDPTSILADEYCKGIDEMNNVGTAEKEYMKEMMRLGLSTSYGMATGDFMPGVGTFKKATKALECFSKAMDSKTTEGTVMNVVEGVEKTVEAVVSVFPGGSLVNAGYEAAKSTVKYLGCKIMSWFS